MNAINDGEAGPISGCGTSEAGWEGDMVLSHSMSASVL